MTSSPRAVRHAWIKRFRLFETRAEYLSRRVLVGAVQRLPITLAAIAHALLLLATPPQLIEIVSAMEVERSILLWGTVLLVPLAAAPLHLILLGRYTKPSRLDAIFVFVPAIALTTMAFRWGGPAPWIAVPLVLLGFVGTLRLLPRIAARHRRLRSLAVAAVLLLFAALVVFSVAAPIGFPRLIGPLAVAAWGISLICLLVAVALLRPILAGAYVAVCLAAAIMSEGSRPVELLPAPKSRYPFIAAEIHWAFRDWLRARPDLAAYKEAGRPYPVVIASAEGGGAYAAAHAYLALSAMQEMCPSFPNHLFATVGVSGGSVGTLLYAAETAPKAEREAAQPCRLAKAQLETKLITQDLLSPPLANLLFVQPLEFLIPIAALFPDSGEVIADGIGELVPGNPRLRAPLRRSWSPNGSQPATLFVTTDVSEGNRFVIAPLEDAGATDARSFPTSLRDSRTDIRANVAAFISARFPWLTPTARLEVAPGEHRVLADGGYYENSGAETALDLLNQIRLIREAVELCRLAPDYDPEACQCPIVIQTQYAEPADWRGCRIPIFLAYMPIVEWTDHDPGFLSDEPVQRQSYLFDPISTMLQARTMRGLHAVARARSTFEDPTPWKRTEQQRKNATGVDFAYFPHLLPIPDMALPLGWKLSEKRARHILTVSYSPEACEAAPGGLSPTRIEHATKENACQMRRLGALLDPNSPAESLGEALDN